MAFRTHRRPAVLVALLLAVLFGTSWVAAQQGMVEFEATQQVVQFNTIADYEAATGNTISAFFQSPMLDALVANGTLPPVEERLPDQPLVLQPADEIGLYGGTMRNAHQGNFDFLEDLLREFPHVYGSNMQGVLPNVFMGVEVSDDGSSFTFSLRPDMKWSDGHPFTADDFVFWYEAVALNEELRPSGVTNMKVGGEMGTVTKVDDTTIRMDFSAPYGILLERLNRWRPMPYRPMHYLSQFHPDYNDGVDAIVAERGFSSWTELFQAEWDWYGNPRCAHHLRVAGGDARRERSCAGAVAKPVLLEDRHRRQPASVHRPGGPAEPGQPGKHRAERDRR